MREHQLIITCNQSQKIQINILDIYQIKIIQLYNDALSYKNIRNLLDALCRTKGMLPYLDEKNGEFSVDLNIYKKYQAPDEQRNIQEKYNSAIIFMVKRMLTAYHQRRPLRLTPYFEKPVIEFDPQVLTNRERGILTKILKQENKRLKQLNIIGRRKKKAYYYNIFMASYS